MERVGLFLLILFGCITEAKCRALLDYSSQTKILNRIVRQAHGVSGWELTSSFKCRIKFNESLYLKYWKKRVIPWGGKVGEKDWDCYSYTDRDREHPGYAFSTRGLSRRYFLVLTKDKKKFVFSNAINAEDAITSERLAQRMIFTPVRSSKTNKDQLRLTMKDQEHCFFHMERRTLIKKCKYPGVNSHFDVCLANSEDC